MIELLIHALQATPTRKSDDIDFLKGKYKMPESIREGLIQFKKFR